MDIESAIGATVYGDDSTVEPVHAQSYSASKSIQDGSTEAQHPFQQDFRFSVPSIQTSGLGFGLCDTALNVPHHGSMQVYDISMITDVRSLEPLSPLGLDGSDLPVIYPIQLVNCSVLGLQSTSSSLPVQNVDWGISTFMDIDGLEAFTQIPTTQYMLGSIQLAGGWSAVPMTELIMRGPISSDLAHLMSDAAGNQVHFSEIADLFPLTGPSLLSAEGYEVDEQVHEQNGQGPFQNQSKKRYFH